MDIYLQWYKYRCLCRLLVSLLCSKYNISGIQITHHYLVDYIRIYIFVKVIISCIKKMVNLSIPPGHLPEMVQK